MISPAVKQWMVLGTGPASAKTSFSLGLCRILADRGIRVAPFKAMAIISQEDVLAGFDPIRPALGVFHQSGACRLTADHDMNPLVVVQTEPRRGELRLRGEPVGEVELLNRDAVRADLLPAGLRERIEAAIHEAYYSLRERFEALVVEGAGSPVELPPAFDWANHLVARMSLAPLLLVTRFSMGGAAAALLGTLTCLEPELRARMLGYVLSDVGAPDAVNHARALIERHTSLRALGIIPRVEHGVVPKGTSTNYEPAYAGWAQAIARSIALEHLGPPF